METLKWKLIAAVGLSAVLLSGCGGMPSMGFSGLFQSDVNAAAKARYANKNTEEALAGAEAAFAKGVEEKLNFYAPEHFEDARDALENARKLASKKAGGSAVFEEAYRTEKNIEDGIQVKAAVKTQLAEPLRYQEALEKRGTDKSFPKEYADAMDELGDLIDLIEAGKPGKITEDLPGLVTELRALEIKTIKFNVLNPGQMVLARTDELDAEKIAPSLHKEASAAFQQADAFIQLNPYEEAKAAELSAAFVFAAKHLLHVTEATIALQGVDKKSLVWGILQQEEQLLKIGKAMGHTDVRDLPLAKQAVALASKAADLRAKEEEAKRLSNELTEAGKTREALKGELTGVQDDTRMAKARVHKLEEQIKQLSANAQGDALLTKTRINDLEKQLKAKSDDSVAAKARIRQLEQRLAASKTNADNLQARVSALDDALNSEKDHRSNLAEELADAGSVEATEAPATEADSKPRIQAPSL